MKKLFVLIALFLVGCQNESVELKKKLTSELAKLDFNFNYDHFDCFKSNRLTTKVDPWGNPIWWDLTLETKHHDVGGIMLTNGPVITLKICSSGPDGQRETADDICHVNKGIERKTHEKFSEHLFKSGK